MRVRHLWCTNTGAEPDSTGTTDLGTCNANDDRGPSKKGSALDSLMHTVT